MLRPLKEVRTKLLVAAGEAIGGRYHLVFRGYHALAGAILIGLFVWVCRARTWADVAALAVGLVVLTGMHTFVGLFREAFPVNHFLIVAICTLATFAVAQTRGGWLADLVAVGLLAVAALSFESGLLVWPVAVAAYASGLRGISRRGLIAMTIVLLVYVGARGLLLKEPALGVGQRATGFGAGALTPEEQVARFGANPLPFYAYNVTRRRRRCCSRSRLSDNSRPSTRGAVDRCHRCTCCRSDRHCSRRCSSAGMCSDRRERTETLA